MKYINLPRVFVGLFSIAGLSACMDIRAVDRDEARNTDQPKVIAQEEKDLPEPQELVISGHRVLSKEDNPFKSNVRFLRVSFEQGAKLTTMGEEVHLETDEVDFANAVIETFPQDSRAGLAGARAGGHITIKADRAMGHVVFELRGENGMPGLSGGAATEDMRGVQGARGVDALHRVRPAGMDAPSESHPFYATCASQAGDGLKGGKGQKGRHGFEGGRGGDAGSLFVDVLDDSELVLEARSLPGQGGPGGPGGQGGAGGPGGKPGQHLHPRAVAWMHTDCLVPVAGPQGDMGDQGDDGARGQDGQRQPICIVKKDGNVCR